jgi:hypothetical protein
LPGLCQRTIERLARSAEGAKDGMDAAKTSDLIWNQTKRGDRDPSLTFRSALKL